MKNKKFIGESWFYTNFKKHYCPNCNSRLEVKKASKIVNSKSIEAKNYDSVYFIVYLNSSDKLFSVEPYDGKIFKEGLTEK